MRPRFLVVFALAVAALGSGCGATTAASGTSGPSTTRAPLPAGATPSEISKMVCTPKAGREIASVLGETATVSDPTWQSHLYSCTYRYPSGAFTLSIKELSSWPETYRYYGSLAEQMGKSRDLENLGQGAYQTTDGSVVVRKDWKVLVVDSSKLPPQFGVPPTSSGAVAVTVADVILGCWEGD